MISGDGGVVRVCEAPEAREAPEVREAPGGQEVVDGAVGEGGRGDLAVVGYSSLFLLTFLLFLLVLLVLLGSCGEWYEGRLRIYSGKRWVGISSPIGKFKTTSQQCGSCVYLEFNRIIRMKLVFYSFGFCFFFNLMLFCFEFSQFTNRTVHVQILSPRLPPSVRHLSLHFSCHIPLLIMTTNIEQRR